MRNARVTGSLALIGSAFLWASAYVFVKHMVGTITPCLLLATRFSVAAIILLLIFLPKLKTIDKSVLIAGIKMGVALFFEFIFFTVGIQYTSASKTSFIIGSYIILLPIAYYIIRRKRPTRGDVLAAIVCMAGVCLLLARGISDINKGDIICVGSAVAYAVHVVYSADYAKKYDGGILNFLQIATAAICAWISVFIFREIPQNSISQLPYTQIIYLALVCTILPYFLCLFGMKRVSTTTSGILLSFESVFATLLAVLTLHEPVYWQLVVGGGLIVSSFFLSEIYAARKAHDGGHGKEQLY